MTSGFGSYGPETQAPREVYAYAPDAYSWSHITDLPEGVNHAGLAHLDGNLYVIGGFR